MASIKSDSYSLSQLFLEPNTLRIPKFQRDYSWTKDQIIQFFEDAEKVLDEDIKNYFFGSIVLIEDGTDILEIVDGQQRIATVLVLLILIRDILREEGSDKGIESADDIQRYIYSKKFASMKESKLILNKNNDSFYTNYLLPDLNPDEKIKNLKDNAKSNIKNKNLYECYASLYSEIKSSDKFKVLEDYLKFVLIVLQNFKLLKVQVDDKVWAYQIFETLNERGLELTTSDLVKNYLLLTGGQKNEDSNLQNWESIESDLEGVDKLSDFLRHSFMANYSQVQTNDLYKEIKKTIDTSNKVVEYLKKLKEDTIPYRQIMTPEKSFWKEEHVVSSVKNLFGVLKNDSAPALFLVAYKEWYNKGKKDDFFKLPHICENIHFRAKTIGDATASKMVDTFVGCSSKVRDSKYDLNKVIQELKKINPPDDMFEQNFKNKSFQNAIATYALSKIENNYLKKIPPSKVVVTGGMDGLSLEHILPQNPSKEWKEEWEKISGAEIEQYKNRIGNLTLLKNRINGKLQDAIFDKKKSQYAHEDIEITRELAKRMKWDKEEIEDRSEFLASYAVEIWSLP